MGRHVKTCLHAYADSENPYQPAYLHSQSLAFNVCLRNHCMLLNTILDPNYCTVRKGFSKLPRNMDVPSKSTL